MACDPLRQWSQDRSPVRRYPAFPKVTGCLRRNYEILDQKGLMTLENRSRWDLDPDHLFFDFDPGRDLAPTGPLLRFPGLRRRGSFFHATRFDVRAPLQAFQPGVFFAQFDDGLLQGGYLTEQFGQQRFELCTVQRGMVGGRRHMMQRVCRAESTQEKNEGLPTFLPLLRNGVIGAKPRAAGGIRQAGRGSGRGLAEAERCTARRRGACCRDSPKMPRRV